MFFQKKPFKEEKLPEGVASMNVALGGKTTLKLFLEVKSINLEP